MSSYNLIPFTDLTATGFTNAVVTTSFTVNSFTVADSTGADAQRFIAVNPGSPVAPPFTFDADQRAGMWLNAGVSAISFSLQGQPLITFRTATNPAAVPPMVFENGTPTPRGAMVGAGTFRDTLTGTVTSIRVANITIAEILTANDFGLNAFSLVFFNFAQGGDQLIRKSSGATSPTILGFFGGTVSPGQYFAKPGLLQQATTTVTPSTARSLAHISNYAAGATVVFVTLPTSVAGLQYTVSNAQATAQTVVVNPVAADTLNVFGLAKAAGASVAANAPFSSITFTCLTSTVWLATKKTGTWT